ncbi:MAG: MarR family winged helix-turn-helix transcriptional regulator [Bacilli bacterium]|jgi:DNA-binding MarR family transcriptional regulator|nr:MarR family winged helix-turn-helix transcriptional regulator [Bacilli bacterium]
MVKTSDHERQIKEAMALVGRCFGGPAPRDLIGYGQGQMRIIYYLMGHGKASPKDLSYFIHSGSGRIGNVLKDMEKRGLIYRKSNPVDKRKTIVGLTALGKKLARDKETRFRERIEFVIASVGEDRFTEYMKEINGFLDEIAKAKKEKESHV